VVTTENETPLNYVTISHKIPDVAFYLIDKGADVNIADYRGDTPLYNATRHDNFELGKRLVTMGCNVNVQNNKLETPLHEAICHANFHAAVYLLEHGADVNAQNEDGECPIHVAAGITVQLVALCLDKGANIEAQSKAKMTPFLKALSDNKLDIAKFLHKQGANVFVIDKDKNNAVHIAADCLRDNPETVEWVVKLGIKHWEKNKTKRSSNTPLELAQKRNSKFQTIAYLQSLPKGGQ